jgi:hypothetical protein
MKRLGIAAAALATMLAAPSANAAMAPVIGKSSPGVQFAGVICGPGMHLQGIACVPNRPMARACPPGFHLGPEGVHCRPN